VAFRYPAIRLLERRRGAQGALCIPGWIIPACTRAISNYGGRLLHHESQDGILVQFLQEKINDRFCRVRTVEESEIYGTSQREE
jgi:hypothetical protein